jgi:hypothetical protein
MYSSVQHCRRPKSSLFVWLISHQPSVLFSQDKPVISNQLTVFFSQNKSAPAISHQPNEQAEDWHMLGPWELCCVLCTSLHFRLQPQACMWIHHAISWSNKTRRRWSITWINQRIKEWNTDLRFPFLNRQKLQENLWWQLQHQKHRHEW